MKRGRSRPQASGIRRSSGSGATLPSAPASTKDRNPPGSCRIRKSLVFGMIFAASAKPRKSLACRGQFGRGFRYGLKARRLVRPPVYQTRRLRSIKMGRHGLQRRSFPKRRYATMAPGPHISAGSWPPSGNVGIGPRAAGVPTAASRCAREEALSCIAAARARAGSCRPQETSTVAVAP